MDRKLIRPEVEPVDDDRLLPDADDDHVGEDDDDPLH